MAKLGEVKGKPSLSLETIGSQVLHLMGEILTIVDVAIVDKQQNKATKDCIKNKVYEKLDWMRKLSTGEFGIVGLDKNGAVVDIPEIRGAVGVSDEDIVL